MPMWNLAHLLRDLCLLLYVHIQIYRQPKTNFLPRHLRYHMVRVLWLDLDIAGSFSRPDMCLRTSSQAFLHPLFRDSRIANRLLYDRKSQNARAFLATPRKVRWTIDDSLVAHPRYCWRRMCGRHSYGQLQHQAKARDPRRV
jgi:hypothetical protein